MSGSEALAEHGGRKLGTPTPGLAATSPILTYRLLAVEDLKAAMHTRCQEQVVVDGMPLEPPHSALYGHVCERLLHVPSVPQENVLVVAETRPAHRSRRKANARLLPEALGGRGTSPGEAHPTRSSRTKSLFPSPDPTLWFKSWSNWGHHASVS